MAHSSTHRYERRPVCQRATERDGTLGNSGTGRATPAIPCRRAVATSGQMESTSKTLQVLGIGSEVPVITRDQVQHAKPDPDLFLAAAERLGVDIRASVVVGDSVWDLLAAQRARALGVGLLSGGYGDDELERAGAYRVYQDPFDLLEHLDEVGIRISA